MRRSGWWTAGAGAALALGIAACGGSDEGSSTTGTGGAAQGASYELKLGALVPLTGDLAAFGPAGRKAAELAVEEANTAFSEVGSGITVSVESADTNTSPQSAQQAARQLISSGASCMTGPYSSGETVPVGVSVARREQVPIISPSATSAEITGLSDDGYVARTAPSDPLQTVALADLAEKDLEGTPPVAIGARNDTYGEGLATSFEEAWTSRGGTVTTTVLYDPDQPNYNSEAQEIMAGDPAAVMIFDFPETYAKVGPALQRTGSFDPKMMFVSDGLSAEVIPDGVPTETMDGARGTRAGTPDGNAATEAFDELYAKAGGPERYTYDAQNFDAAMICILASVAAGSNEGSEIAEHLTAVTAPEGEPYTWQELPQAIEALLRGEDIDYQGVSGPIDFDENGDTTSATYDSWRYDGRKLVVTGSSTISAEQG